MSTLKVNNFTPNDGTLINLTGVLSCSSDLTVDTVNTSDEVDFLKVNKSVLSTAGWITPQTISSSFSVPSDHNARLIGPSISVADGVTLTVEADSYLMVEEI